MRVLIVLDLRVHQRHAIHGSRGRSGETTRRTRGVRLGQRVKALAPYLRERGGYFSFCETPSVLGELDSWVRRRLRCVVWEQCGNARGRYAELKKRGVDAGTAAQAAVSDHGPWRFSRSVVLSVALPESRFASPGLPTLTARRVN